MIVTEYSLALYIAISIVGGFLLGVWLQRIFVWYPFGLKPLTGKESMVGKKAAVTLVKPSYIEVKIDSQIWKARVIGTNHPKMGDMVTVKDVMSNTLLVEQIMD